MNFWARPLAYLAASVLFIYCLRGLTHPRTAVGGNFRGAVGMLLALLLTLFEAGLDYRLIFALGLGAIAATLMAQRVSTSAMP